VQLDRHLQGIGEAQFARRWRVLLERVLGWIHCFSWLIDVASSKAPARNPALQITSASPFAVYAADETACDDADSFAALLYWPA
jgi:hypothetical protein